MSASVGTGSGKQEEAPVREARDHCGVFGVFGHERAAELVRYGLYALQHRGQESAGIASTSGSEIVDHRGMGLVNEIFTPAVLGRLKNTSAIGHVRYSTTGASNVTNAQPIVVRFHGEQVALGHNGNLVNAWAVREALDASGHILQTTSDSELFLHLMARGGNSFRESLLYALQLVKGAYSLVFLTRTQMVGVRDPSGFRPLCLGRLGSAYVLASETCALDAIRARFEREVNPGEIVHIDRDGLRSESFARPTPAHCIFELIYFARADSTIFGDSVYEVRKRFGEQLAREHPAAADMVVSVPDSANAAALGYQRESRLPLEIAFVRNPYVGRSFIQPAQSDRTQTVEIKLNVVRDAIRNKRIVVVDDSIIRGNTTRTKVVDALRRAGAAEVHLRISCPPHRFGCYYGIDFPNPEELIAYNRTVEGIRRELNVDSLGYLSIEGMLRCVAGPPEHYCTACFSGNYPVKAEEKLDKLRLGMLNPVSQRRE